MNKEDKLILGTLAGVDLVLSPEHYEEYKGTLNKQLEEKDKEIDRLNKEYERIYNENCKLREEHNITDIKLLDENNRLNNIVNKLEEYCWELKAMGCREGALDILDKIKALKENDK